jgi:hypothetical protein
MPEQPWRCSQCGTINEPVANSCRTCGKWPSLFDLEDNFVEDDDFEPISDPAPAPVLAPVPTYDAPDPMTIETDTFEPEPFEPAPVEQPRRRFEPPPTEPVFEEGEAQRGPRWVSWLVPLAFVAYLVISYVFSSR